MKKNIQVKKSEEGHIIGIYKFTEAKIETPAQWRLNDKIAQLKKMGKDYIYLVRKLNKICDTKVSIIPNIIPIVARTMIANNLTNSSPDDVMRINYTALGTGTTAVANGDTTLVTETYRTTTGSATNANNIAYVTAFYTAEECNGTYKEAGLFSDAIDSTDDGILFSRVLLNAPTGIAKTVTKTLSIDYTITIS